jgi:hypothetical protein
VCAARPTPPRYLVVPGVVLDNLQLWRPGGGSATAKASISWSTAASAPAETAPAALRHWDAWISPPPQTAVPDHWTAPPDATPPSLRRRFRCTARLRAVGSRLPKVRVRSETRCSFPASKDLWSRPPHCCSAREAGMRPTLKLMRERWVGLSRLAKFVLVATAAGTTVLIVAALAYLFFPAIGTPSRAALHYSLAKEAGGTTLFEDIYKCRHEQRELWRCDVADSSGSGVASYRLRMDGRRCWHARKLTPDSREEGPALDPQPSSCVKLHDQVRLLHGLLD